MREAAAARARVGSDSGPETGLRMLLEDHGLGGLELDHALFDDRGRLAVQPDIAVPEHRLSLQYEGRTTTTVASGSGTWRDNDARRPWAGRSCASAGRTCTGRTARTAGGPVGRVALVRRAIGSG